MSRCLWEKREDGTHLCKLDIFVASSRAESSLWTVSQKRILLRKISRLCTISYVTGHTFAD